MGIRQKCIICRNENAELGYDLQGNTLSGYQYYQCPNCGMYVIPGSSCFLFDDVLSRGQRDLFDKTKLTSYLFYHKLQDRYAFVGTQYDFDRYIDVNPQTEAFLVTVQMVDAWYPKTFSEKVDLALLWLAKHSDYMGKSVAVPKEDMKQVFFLTNSYRKTTTDGERVAQDWATEVKFLLRYLHHNDLLEYHVSDESIKTLMERMAFTTYPEPFRFTLSSKAYDTIYEFKKSTKTIKMFLSL